LIYFHFRSILNTNELVFKHTKHFIGTFGELKMARKQSTHLTDGEQSIMEVLWEQNEASVRQIADELSKSKPTAYTTVQTLCKILTEKGYADFRKEGKAFIYQPKITQKEARQSALTSILNKFFGGSPKVLAQHLMQETDIDINDLEALQLEIDKSSDGKEDKK
jgi:predicted transcriptional regulator